MHDPITEPLYYCVLQEKTTGSLEMISHKTLDEFKKACAAKDNHVVVGAFCGLQLKVQWKTDLIVEG